MDATTLTLTITSLVISVLAAVGTVGQAIWTRRATTRLFRIEARFGYSSGHGVTSSPKFPDARHVAQVRSQGFTDAVVGVVLQNTGALPLVVDRWAIVVPGGTRYVPGRNEVFGPSLPHQVLAGGSADWWTDARNMLGLVAAASALGPAPNEFRIVVECGDGTARTSQAIQVPGA